MGRLYHRLQARVAEPVDRHSGRGDRQPGPERRHAGDVVALGAVVVGILLAALSAVGPAWMAARLAPMEAMRVE